MLNCYHVANSRIKMLKVCDCTFGHDHTSLIAIVELSDHFFPKF